MYWTTGTKMRHFDRHVQNKTSKAKLLHDLVDGMKEFSQLTSLHGFKYIGENRFVSEKIFWGCVLISVFILCGFQTFALIKYWMAGKTIMTQETADLHVWDIPFPAITICSENQLNRTRMDAAKYELHADDYQDVIDYADIMCHSNYYEDFSDNPISNSALEYASNNLVLPCNETIVSFVWINDLIPSSCQYLQPILADRGICFSHNIIPLAQLFGSEYLDVAKSHKVHQYFYETNVSEPNWHIVRGFRHQNPLTPPWRVAGAGVYNSVKIVFNLRAENFRNYCNVSGYGMSIIVHSPSDFPPQYNSLYLRPNTYNVLLVTAELETVSSELQNWSPFVRGCYYPGEKYLRFFKVYSLPNCELECRANKTLRTCGCSAFGHPRLRTTPVCGLGQRKCIATSGGAGYSILNRVKNATTAEDSYYKKNCLCLPPCQDLTYNFDFTEMKKNVTRIRNLNTEAESEHQYSTVLEIYFKRDTIDVWRRSPMIRFAELVGNIGGILSLCVGCSIISLFEVIYFVTLRKRPTKLQKIRTRRTKSIDGS